MRKLCIVPNDDVFPSLGELLGCFDHVVFITREKAMAAYQRFGHDRRLEIHRGKASGQYMKAFHMTLNKVRGEFDSIWLSKEPGATKSIIMDAFNYIDCREYSHLVTVDEISFSPKLILKRTKKGFVRPFHKSEKEGYLINGVLYGARWNTFDGYFLTPRTFGLVMPNRRTQ